MNPVPEEAFDVSVAVPAHNEEKYVLRCLESIRAAAEGYDRLPDELFYDHNDDYP